MNWEVCDDDHMMKSDGKNTPDLRSKSRAWQPCDEDNDDGMDDDETVWRRDRIVERMDEQFEDEGRITVSRPTFDAPFFWQLQNILHNSEALCNEIPEDMNPVTV